MKAFPRLGQRDFTQGVGDDESLEQVSCQVSFRYDTQQQIGDHRHPDLCQHCVLVGAEEGLDLQMLLDPLEEQLHLPTPFVQIGDSLRREIEAVGEELHVLLRFRIDESDEAERFRVCLSGFSFEVSGPVAPNTASGFDRVGVTTDKTRPPLHPGDKERAVAVQTEPISAVEVTAVENQRDAR